MIAVDSSTFIHGLNGVRSSAVDLMRRAAAEERLVLPEVVVTEILSFARATPDLRDVLSVFPRIPVLEGFWDRTGETRRTLLKLGLKARLGDSLVAQSCLDAGLPLIAGDTDFRHFVVHCGLKLAT